MKKPAPALHFLNEAYQHCKTIAAAGASVDVLRETYFGAKLPKSDWDAASMIVAPGVIAGAANQSAKVASAFVEAMAQHGHWSREKEPQVPA